MTTDPNTHPTMDSRDLSRQSSINDLPTVGAPDASSGHQLAESSVHNSLVTTANVARKSTEPAPPGSLVERYTLRSVLGQGGYGCVHEAWDELLQRSVAIKVARRESFGDSKGCQNFIDEARAVAKLNHPHIVKVYDCGTDSESNPFVVFELVSGESIAQRTERQPLLLDQVIRIVASIAEAVHVAHKAGMIHRDLKPANILLDENCEPRVTDFGLAVDEHSQREQAGVIAGSWAYMSPEQVRGESHYLDGRTDIWSIGVILYELLAKRRPFSGRTTDELKDEILNREPKPLRQIDDAIPNSLEKICARCLAKPIKDRYSSAADLVKDLRGCLKKSTSSRWRSTAAAGVFAASLLGFALIQHYPKQSDDINRSPLVAPLRPEEPEIVVDAQNQVPLAGPELGAWFPLFERPFEKIIWPADSRNSRCDLLAKERELWVTCESVGFIKLGEATDVDYTIKLKLFQSPWVGGIGIFFGGHNVIANNQPCRRLQIIELTCIPRQLNSAYYLKRRIATFDGDGVQNNVTISEPPIAAPRPREQTLLLSVVKHRLTYVEWEGNPVDFIASDDSNAKAESSDYAGDLGIFLAGSSAVFRHPELLVTRKNP